LTLLENKSQMFFLIFVLVSFYFSNKKSVEMWIARSKPELFGEFWDELASFLNKYFEGFLFPDSIDSQ
jgi:hypothetical protein